MQVGEDEIYLRNIFLYPNPLWGEWVAYYKSPYQPRQERGWSQTLAYVEPLDRLKKWRIKRWDAAQMDDPGLPPDQEFTREELIKFLWQRWGSTLRRKQRQQDIIWRG